MTNRIGARLRWWWKWHFTEDGATASLIYHDWRNGPIPLTKGQALTLAKATRSWHQQRGHPRQAEGEPT